MNINKMDSDYIFLVFFTVLSQSAAGIFILREVMLYSSYNYMIDKHLRIITLLIAGLIVLIAIITASFHLGKPLQAVHTLRNLKSSWLSREILFILIFSGIILLYLFTEFFTESSSIKISLSISGIIAALGLIVCMSGIYMLKTIPVWNTFLTPSSFFLTSALTGISVMFIIIPAGFGKGSIIYPVFSLLMILSLIVSAFLYFTGETSSVLLLITRLVTGLMALLVPLLIYCSIIPNKMPSRLFLFMLLLFTEIIGRCIFYTGFYKSGL